MDAEGEMCESGRIAVRGDPRFREGRRWVRRQPSGTAGSRP